MSDLQIAENRLHKRHLSMAIVKDGEILFETRAQGISGFFQAIDRLGKGFEGASVADKVAGKAVALLCVYVRVKEVYADVLSQRAKTVFDDNGIPCKWTKLVENILDLSKSRLCPFEEMARNIWEPSEAYHSFGTLLKSLKL